MEQIQHIVTPEIAEEVKANLEKALEKQGKPMQTVLKASFAKGKIEFLYTYMTYGKYLSIVENRGYQQMVEKDPRAAEKWLEVQLLQDCVLWPPQFDPTERVELQPYPAGVIPGLVERIQAITGFVASAAPDVVVVAPELPDPPTDEELEKMALEHPIARNFDGAAFGKPFFVRDYNPETRQFGLVPVRYYVYTMIDGQTFAEARSKSTQEEFINHICEKCMIWPQNINWSTEPANYREWIVDSIMRESAFGQDPSAGVEDEEI